MVRDKFALFARCGLLLVGVVSLLAFGAGPGRADEEKPPAEEVGEAEPPPPVVVLDDTPLIETPTGAAPADPYAASVVIPEEEASIVFYESCVGEGYKRCTRWMFQVEGGVSFFENPEGIIGEPLPPGVTPLRWGALDYGEAVGFRGTIGYYLRNRDRIEIRGYWLGQWDDSSRQTGQFAVMPTPQGAPVLSPVATADMVNETEVWGGEFNWWRGDCDPCYAFEWGIGARYLRLDDRIEASNWVGLARDSFLRAEAENAFYAAQFMGATRVRLAPKLVAGASGKLLLGWMNRDITERDVSIVTGGPSADAHLEDTGFTWGFEGELSLLYRITPRVGVTASYTLLYLQDVARASTSLDYAQAATGSVQLLVRPDSTLIHSLFLGVRIDL